MFLHCTLERNTKRGFVNRYAAEDAYMMHEYTYQDREVFMVTNNRIMYLSYNSGTSPTAQVPLIQLRYLS
jgi:hypothetical protein